MDAVVQQGRGSSRDALVKPHAFLAMALIQNGTMFGHREANPEVFEEL